MKIPFVTVDVFTSKPFGGNPLAVVLDGKGLGAPQMQRIASEFNLAETTFVLPPKNDRHTAEVRIFTPRSELPFAGHPNVGTACVLAQRMADEGVEIPEALVFEEKAGLVTMDLRRDQRRVVGARLEAPRPFERTEDIDEAEVSNACAVDLEEIERKRHPPCVISCGIPFATVELKTRQALANAAPRTDSFIQHFPIERVTGIHLYVRNKDDGPDIEVRMFAPLQGVPEDAATGSANVAWVGLEASLERNATDVTRTISQGVDMGRPSWLEAEAKKRDDGSIQTWIGGGAVPMMEGFITIS